MPAPPMQTSTPEPVALDRSYWDCTGIDTDAHIACSLGQPLSIPDHISTALGDQYVSDCEAVFCRWFARLTHNTYHLVHRDNTYNHEQDLTEQVIFTVFAPVAASDWCWCDDLFIVIERHLGGDVRGNYGEAEVFRVDSLADKGFLDWCVGWHVAPVNPARGTSELERINDRLTIGYSSRPTSELEQIVRAGSKPVWSERRGSWVAVLEDYPAPVLLTPLAPYYG